MKKNPVLLFPLLILAFVMVIDKAFLIGGANLSFLSWNNFDEESYGSRRKVFGLFSEELADSKINDVSSVFIFGTSRLLSLPPGPMEKEERYVYNFSANQASPSHYYYWIDRILEASSNKIDFVVLEVDSTVLREESSAISLAYSYDPQFVLKNISGSRCSGEFCWESEEGGFTLQEIDSYFLKLFFTTYKYPVSFKNYSEIRKEMIAYSPSRGLYKTSMLKFKNDILKKHEEEILKKRGSVSHNVNFTAPSRNMILEVNHESRRYLEFSSISPSQVYFLAESIDLLASKRIPVILYWPVVSGELRNEFIKYNKIDSYQNKINQLILRKKRKYPGSQILFLDPYADTSYECRSLVDTHHLTSECLHYLSEYFSGKIHRMTEGNN